jgi:hypothetical protein
VLAYVNAFKIDLTSVTELVEAYERVFAIVFSIEAVEVLKTLNVRIKDLTIMLVVIEL